MNGFILLFPFLWVRFGVLFLLNKKAIRRAAYFAPVQGEEKIAYFIYQISTAGIFIYLFFLSVKIGLSWQFFSGLFCYGLGLCLSAITMVCFSFPDGLGLNTNGIYRFSRNPMYLAYFICFLGMALLTQSLILFGMIVVFQISAHWIILSEERWCLKKFGATYQKYMETTRRYL